MSGDVQPRKRKDKRRKKDEEESGTPPPTIVNSPSESSTENVSIHVYKESSTGGHWCARIVFFVLLAVLVGLIGIIIFEHRGTTDVDTPLESSRWAFVFDGWVDDSPPSHDEEPHDEKAEASEEAELEEAEEEDEHGEEEEEAEGSKEEDEHDEEEDEGIGEDEEQEDEAEAAEESAEEEQQVDEEEDEGEYASKEVEDQDEDEGIEEGNEDEEEEAGAEEEEEDTSQQDFDDAGVLEEVNAGSEEANDEEEENEQDEVDNEFDDGEEASEEQKNDEGSEEFMGMPGVNVIDDDSAEPLEEVEGTEPEEDVNDVDIEPDIEEIEEESASVAVKFGVGVALVVAAHFVLVRRWNNVDGDISDINDTPELLRRNTIVPPPRIKQVIPSPEKEEKQVHTKKQAQNYEELRSKYNKLEVDNASQNVLTQKSLDPKNERVQAKSTWATRSPGAEDIATREQSKVISSEEEENDGEDLENSDGERASGAEDYDEEVEEEEEDEEVEEEEEEEDENIDDSELIAKLEAKYGKLPTPQDSEEEEEEELEEDEEVEEDDEEVEDDEEMAGWKHVKAPKDTPAKPGSTSKPSDGAATKAKQEDPVKSRGGPKSLEFNISSIDDIVVHEENDSGIHQEFDN